MLALAALVGSLVFVGVSAAQTQTSQTGGGSSISYPPGEQEAPGSNTLIVPSGRGTGTINYSASCPLNGGNPAFHYWYVEITLTHADGATQGSGPLFSQTGSTSASGKYGFTVGIDPPTAKSDTISWEVTGCGGQNFGGGSFTLQRCDPDAYDKAQTEYEAARRANKAGFDDLARATKEIQQFIKDYINDSIDIVPEKADALNILKLISEDVAYRTEVTGLVVGLSITAEQLDLLRQDYKTLSDSAQQEFDLAKQLEASANLNLGRALQGGCRDRTQDQLKKLLHDQKLADKARALIDSWQNNGYLYVSPISHEVVDEATALRQAKAALTAGNQSADDGARASAHAARSVKVTATQVRTAIRYIDDARGLGAKARRQLSRLEAATNKAVAGLKLLLG